MQALGASHPGRDPSERIRASREDRSSSSAKCSSAKPRTKSSELSATSTRQPASAKSRASGVTQVVSRRRIELLDSFPSLETDQIPVPAFPAADHTSNIAPGKQCGTNCRYGPGAPRLRVAVDIDEVLGSFLKTLSDFCEEEYDIFHELEEFFIYDFKQVWKCSQEEANRRVHAFFDSHHFHHGIPTIPGASATLQRLTAHCEFVVVTSRQHVIQQSTLRWLETHYPGLFDEVHFGNHYALEGKSKAKSEICREAGATVLIDDNPGYARECAEQGLRVLLFDWDLKYAWSKTDDGPNHPLITRVRDWSEVEKQLLLLVRN